jgi:hypothetical protein
MTMPKHPHNKDAGARVDRPPPPKRTKEPSEGTNSGNEAAGGIQSKKGGPTSGRAGLEPLKERENKHESGYGGKGGAPRSSSDQR